MNKSSAFKSLALAGFIIFVGYEARAVVAARSVTHELFAKYEAATHNGEKSPTALTAERLEKLIKVQDPNFWKHDGVDWSAPLTTTTVTQSIVKKLYFEKFEPGFAKIKQSLIAHFAVDPLTSKNAQLAAFIDVNGFDAASWKWFGKPLEALDDDQYLSLLATNNTPKVAPGTPENADRVRRIKNYLAGQCERRGLADVWLERCGD
ncbi:transglycosylase domain-containing protein [Rhodoblastus sp.]|jgi:membrane carboxypeptidase/penicillin-binding protein PbpC|uniref:transglycosylase domain-containing protein n=1 Tax=Rhodoblastus sp. TaxID=1962975 RepID=UPI0025FB6E2B|nr:transglycosylase domain-containing protein [Rhodoblastus sp.]